MVGNSVAICEHFITVNMEGITVFAMLVTLMMNHQLIEIRLMFFLAVIMSSFFGRRRLFTMNSALRVVAAALVTCDRLALAFIAVMLLAVESLGKHLLRDVIQVFFLLLLHQVPHFSINSILVDPALVSHIICDDQLMKDLVMQIIVSLRI